MKAFKTHVGPTYILKYAANKNLLSQGNAAEISYLRGMLHTLFLQDFISVHTRIRFERILLKAESRELKLNTYKDNSSTYKRRCREIYTGMEFSTFAFTRR